LLRWSFWYIWALRSNIKVRLLWIYFAKSSKFLLHLLHVVIKKQDIKIYTFTTKLWSWLNLNFLRVDNFQFRRIYLKALFVRMIRPLRSSDVFELLNLLLKYILCLLFLRLFCLITIIWLGLLFNSIFFFNLDFVFFTMNCRWWSKKEIW
jgi:hypothetical protein